MKVTGSNITIIDSVVNKMQILPLGNCEQDTIAYVDVGTWEQGIIDSNGGNVASNYWVRTADYIPVKSNVLYNISRTIATEYMAFWFYDNTKTFVGTNETSGLITTNLPGKQNRMRSGDTSIEVTINNANVAYMRMADASNDLSTIYTISAQAPNPSYPQDVKVVTGDNEVVVSNSDNTQSQSYTLHLGSLELCKIGDYQDVILGSKDNWKVVKKVGKIASYNGETITTDYISTTGGLDTGALVYYGLATPIEETISDQTLINELNELQELLSYDGTTNITITSDSNNAQMIVQVTYTSESDMNEKLTEIFNSIKSKLYHIIRAL